MSSALLSSAFCSCSQLPSTSASRSPSALPLYRPRRVTVCAASSPEPIPPSVFLRSRFRQAKMVTIVEEEEAAATAAASCSAGPDRDADGWETASEGGDDTVAGGGGGGDQFEDALTEEQQKQRILAQAEATKAAGNAEYSQGRYKEALASYSAAMELLTDSDKAEAKDIRAMCLCNRAMCYIQLGEYEEAVQESSKALELEPEYVKALFRRAQALEKVDKLEDALADMKRILELEPANREARAAVQRLQPVVTERQEKLKEEMIGKLKDLGNSILGRFGMNIDNFKAVQDPVTGSYSLSYQQQQ